ncbi:MAG: DUF6252 family protein [Bacteroidota bacterium]
MIKQIPLSLLALVMVLLFQNCKKGSDDVAATATPVLQATINSIVWTPDTLSANITYNAATKTKVFNFSGTYNQRRLTCAVTLSSATSTNDFTLNSYTIDASGNPLITYSVQQKDSAGNYVFVPIVTAGNGDGLVTITAVDSASGLISGTFSFTTKKLNYDTDGNITTITNTVVSGGAFTKMPYTFISQ